MLPISTLVAFSCYFWHLTVQPGMINEWLPRLADSWPEWVKKPLYDCPTCLTIWWGAVLLILCHFTTLYRGRWLVWCLILAAASTIATIVGRVVSACMAVIKIGEVYNG